MQSLSSGKELPIHTISSNGVFGEFIDPFITSTINTTKEEVMTSRSDNKPSMYYYFNDHLIQVFYNKNNITIDNNDNINNNNDFNKSSELLLQISLEDLGRLTPVEQVNQVLSCTYENKPVLIIVASFPSEEEKDVYNTLFWLDVFSGTLKLICLDESLMGTICSSHAMHTPMMVPSGTTKELSKVIVPRQVLAFGMQNGSIRMIMLEYPIRNDVFHTSSMTIEVSELDGSPVTAVELLPPNSHHQFFANIRSSHGRRQNSINSGGSSCHDARLIAGTIKGFLVHFKVQPFSKIDVSKPNRIKKYTFYDDDAITQIKTLRDGKNDTKCVIAVGQDSSWNIGRAVTSEYNKQACINIIELYGNNKKSWLFVIRPSDIKVACEVTSMRLLPATLGYSIIIVFRAIDGSMSETVCHTIFPNRKGKLDFSVVRNRSDWILDAYPFDEKYLPLIQTTLIQKPQNTIEPSSNGQLVSTKLKEESSYVKETDNSKARSLVKAILNQFSREPPAQSRSQTTVEYDSPPSDIGSDDNNTSGSLQEVSPAIHVSDDSDEPIMEIDHQTGTSEDVIGNVSHESQDTVDSTKDIYHKAQQPTEMMNAETDANVIYQVEMNYNEKSMMNGHNSDIDDDNNSKEEKSMNDCEDEYQHDDLQESPEVTICSDYDMEHHIVKPIVSDTSVSSEDETYPSTTEKSKEASPDTSEADEVVQKIIRIPRVISAEEDEQKYEYIDDDQSSNVSMENEKQKANDLVFGNDFQSIAPPPPPSSSSSFVENTRLSFPFTPENLSAPTSLSSSYDQYQNQEENYMSDSPQSIPILSSTIITEESTNSNDPYPIFNTETATSVASPSPKMLKADEDTTSPSPLQLNNDDYHVHNTPSPYEYIPISPSDPPIQYQDEEEPEEGEIIESSSSPSPPYSNHVPSSPISSRGLFLQDQPQVNRERSVDQQLFIDVMLQELYYKYNKSYPTLNLELELLLARPADTQDPHWKAHTHARYYTRLRETEDEQIVNQSNINITEEEQNLVITCWLLDRCKYKQALMYLRKNCDTRPYAYKIMKTLEKGLGAEEARACMEEIEASKDDNISVFNPEAWVQLLQEESLVNALAYINNNKKVAIIRNDLIKVVCNTLINGPSIPSVQDIRQLGIFEYADEQRDWLLTFATNTDSVAAKTLLIYLYLKKEQKGEAVLLNRELQKKKPKVQLSAEEDALYNQCQELEDKVYDLEPALARELPPEIALFPPGQARPPYQNFLREHGINAARLLLGPILSKRLEEANKRLREETAAEGQNPNKYRKL